MSSSTSQASTPAPSPETFAPGDVLLSIRNLSKTFPGVKALNSVDLDVRSGEVLALLGHNGSGKSTVVKVLAGIYRPDEGSDIDVRADLHFIHQDLGLVLGLNTIENLDLDSHTSWRDLLPFRRSEAAEARKAIARFGGDFDVRASLSEITPAERTIVAIARATSSWTSPRNILILDEPTATLHGGEAERLRDVVRGLAAEGAAIVWISHHLQEVVELADRAVVLRDGQEVMSKVRGDFTQKTLLTAIGGDKLTDAGTHSVKAAGADLAPPVNAGQVRLKVTNLVTERLVGLDFDARAGEVLGISGQIGSGREQVLGSIFGARPTLDGTIAVDDRPTVSTPRTSMRAGLAYVPADRRGLASIGLFTARENLTLAKLPSTSFRRPMLARGPERRVARAAMAEVDVRPLDPERPFALFSGGNQQKIVIAKWLRTDPKVVLLDEPTQGVDVGARAGIHSLVRETARGGAAVVVASSDEDELVTMCDRVIVLRDGELVAELTGADITEAAILRASLTSSDE